MRLIHRLILLRYGVPPDFALNRDLEPPDAAASEPVAADLRRIINAPKAEGFDVEHGRVDYARLRSSPVYAEYRQCAARLRSFDPAMLSRREERLAFWINLYNALIVDAVIRLGVRRSVNEAPGFFWRAAYDIGGRRYCSFDIEYGILRGNRGHPAIPGPHFGPRDPRLAYSLERLDPRIHFALVCAARSCPPIGVYDAERIDAQLDLAARAFINNGGVEVNRSAGEIRLSQIFRWYAPDFGGRPLGMGDKTPLLEYIADYLDDEGCREFVLRSRPKVLFLRYDWSLNQ
ncbi:MAG TPA: DUF547 domain-containing protein [Anaerolineae bacterium]|nr:DUF547 domain-containing protein [Anaerolineae bacterium]